MIKRGDVYLVDLEPTRGHEQQGRRPVLVVSKSGFDRVSLPLICPITNGGGSARSAGFTVPLAASGMKSTGVVLCNQIRALDVKARRGKKIERAPDFIVDEVLDALQVMLEKDNA